MEDAYNERRYNTQINDQHKPWYESWLCIEQPTHHHLISPYTHPPTPALLACQADYHCITPAGDHCCILEYSTATSEEATHHHRMKGSGVEGKCSVTCHQCCI